jgi:hypothetical protein
MTPAGEVGDVEEANARFYRAFESLDPVLVTNLFERTGGRWLMVHHHASHVFSADAPTPPEEPL